MGDLQDPGVSTPSLASAKHGGRKSTIAEGGGFDGGLWRTSWCRCRRLLGVASRDTLRLTIDRRQSDRLEKSLEQSSIRRRERYLRPGSFRQRHGQTAAATVYLASSLNAISRWTFTRLIHRRTWRSSHCRRWDESSKTCESYSTPSLKKRPTFGLL